jgi:hypothetical protein
MQLDVETNLIPYNQHKKSGPKTAFLFTYNYTILSFSF